jgi:hypothetical protein
MRSSRDLNANLWRGFLPISPNNNPDAGEKFLRRGLRRQAGRSASTLLSLSCKMQANSLRRFLIGDVRRCADPRLYDPPLSSGA